MEATPVSCAAALASLKVLLNTNIIGQVPDKEKLILEELKHPIVKVVRSSGLMMALELTHRKYIKHVVHKCFDQGVLVDYFLFNNRCIRMAPPLIYTFEQLKLVCGFIKNSLDYAQNQYKK